MATCGFCKRDDFASRPSVCAHLKWCPEYLRHKQRKAALGTPLKHAVPKAESNQAPVSVLSPPPIDPLAPFKKALQDFGVLQSNTGDAQETPQQRRRRVLQTAKIHARDHCWSFIGTVTAEMRAAGTLAIERELRNEPLEEWPVQEVNELAAGIRDRIYNSLLHRKEKEARRSREADARTRAHQREVERTEIESRKKKAAYLEEAQRRIVTLLKTRPCSPLQRIQVLAEALSLLDATLTGSEPLGEAYAAIEAVLQARMDDWKVEEVARQAKQQAEWWDIATAVGVVSVLGYLYARAPEMLQWLLKMLSPEPSAEPANAQKPTPDAPPVHASGEPIPPRPIRRIRRPPLSPIPGSPISPSKAECEN